METTELYKIADKSGVQIDRFNMPDNRSASISYMDKLFVALDPSVSGAEERVCLAHELGHCETMSFYNIYSPLDVRGKHERRANIWAIKAMVPLSAYKHALKRGFEDIYSLAEYFGVTEDFMREAVNYYKSTEQQVVL